MNEILKKLSINGENYGACVGASNYMITSDSGSIESFNPSNGELLAKVNLCSESDYENVIKESEKAFEEWRMVPAPVRGELIRKIKRVI